MVRLNLLSSCCVLIWDISGSLVPVVKWWRVRMRAWESLSLVIFLPIAILVVGFHSSLARASDPAVENGPDEDDDDDKDCA
jgi:hypothetical protein